MTAVEALRDALAHIEKIEARQAFGGPYLDTATREAWRALSLGAPNFCRECARFATTQCQYRKLAQADWLCCIWAMHNGTRKVPA